MSQATDLTDLRIGVGFRIASKLTEIFRFEIGRGSSRLDSGSKSVSLSVGDMVRDISKPNISVNSEAIQDLSSVSGCYKASASGI